MPSFLNQNKSPWILSLAVFLLCDFAAGRAFTAMEKARLREYERVKAVERAQGRTKSALFHHDLIPQADVKVPYGREFYSLRANSLGLRDSHPRKISLRSSRARVLLIGDSFTEGLGVDYEYTFSGLAQKEWAKQGVEVLNAAVSSYSPIIYLAKIRHLIEKVNLEFNQVVVFLDISDIQDEAQNYYFDKEGNIKGRLDEPEAEHQEMLPAEGTAPKPKSPWIQNSITLRAVSMLLSIREFKFEIPAKIPAKSQDTPLWDYKAVLDMKRSLWTVQESVFQEYGQEGLAIAKAHMDELLKLLNDHNIRLAVAVYPWPDQIYYQDLHSKQVLFWQAWAQENKVQFINYFPYFVNERPWEEILNDFFIPGDIHWNKKGHRLVADVLIQELILPR